MYAINSTNYGQPLWKLEDEGTCDLTFENQCHSPHKLKEKMHMIIETDGK